MRSTASFLRSTLILLAVGTVVLLGIVISSLWLVHLNSEYSDKTAELRRIRSSAVDLLTALQDTETGQRGFLLTNDQTYLSPYQKALIELPERRKRLSDNVAAYPEYAGKLGELAHAIDQKMAELTETINLARNGKLPEAVDIVKNNTGKDDMVNIRAILGGFLNLTDNRLRDIVGQQLDAADNLQWVTVGGALMLLVVLAGAITVIVQHVRELSRARSEVEALNVGLEERVEERTRDLMQANQEIQRFAHIVTHDLRAPLVNIMGFLSELDISLKPLTAYVLSDESRPTEDDVRDARHAVQTDVPEAMSFIRSSAAKMDSLINAILKLSREGRRKLQPERIDLRAQIETAAASLHHQMIASGAEMEIVVAVSEIVTDRFSLDQILANLFDNAIKYQVPERPLRLSVRVFPQGRGYVGIDVKDNGRGIARQDFERIFEMFRRAGDQDQKGEGIGLAYVRSLTRNLGGDISVRSELGSGSTFTLRLPSDLNKIAWSLDA
ncbi:MAG: CHASE3 domain-containing protein [Rhizobiaceae bacterium]|nr:CHASE3 domain-containing protein [Rhizobiaceae bacterium]